MLKKVFLLGLLFVQLSAEPLVLVTNLDSPMASLTKSQVKMIYLKKRRYWGSTKLVTLNLPPQSALRKQFEQNVLAMSQKQLEQYWIKQHYKGYRPPYRVESVTSVLLFVKKVEGAMGYVPLSKVSKEVKVLYRGLL